MPTLAASLNDRWWSVEDDTPPGCDGVGINVGDVVTELEDVDWLTMEVEAIGNWFQVVGVGLESLL
jgi:hypothetical protein